MEALTATVIFLFVIIYLVVRIVAFVAAARRSEGKRKEE